MLCIRKVVKGIYYFGKIEVIVYKYLILGVLIEVIRDNLVTENFRTLILFSNILGRGVEGLF